MRAAFPDFKPGWTVFVNDTPFNEANIRVESRFGSAHPAVVMHSDGTPNFERWAYTEAPAVNVIAWGRKKRWFRKPEVYVAVIRQPRPHADDPEHPGVDGHSPIVFGQIPMGFAEKVLGGKFETAKDAASREVGEETGATAVINVTKPKCPWHNPNPTFVTSWTDLLFVEVDLEKVEQLKRDRNEPIYSAEYIPISELIQRIREGKDDEGAIYRMCTSNSLWMIFFATFPELWPC